jgi:hypothetical protein
LLASILSLVRSRWTNELSSTFVGGAERREVRPSLFETQCPIRSAADHGSVSIILPVVFPEAHGTNLVGTPAVEREEAATRAGEAVHEQSG